MATDYQFADGFDNAVGLTTPPRQPATDSLPQWETFTPQSAITQRIGGGRIRWTFEGIFNDELDAVMDFFGLDHDGTQAKNCTVRQRTDSGTQYANYNAVVRLVESPAHNFGNWRVVYEFSRLEAI